MNYGLNPSVQADLVFLSLGFGFLCGLLRDVLKWLRVLLSDKTGVVFAEDVLFWLLWTCLNFLFSMAVCSGQIRFYMLVSQGTGFAIWYFFMSRLTKRLLVFCFGMVEKYIAIPVKKRFTGIKDFLKKKKRFHCCPKTGKTKKKKTKICK